MVLKSQAIVELPADDRELAQAAMDWILGSDDDIDLSTLGLLNLCNFLWYSLPRKWLVDVEKHLSVARALGGLFAVAGLERYSSMCASEQTEQLIRTYDQDADKAGTDYQTAIAETGVLAPDTDVLAWSRAQGVVEHTATWACAKMLEDAIITGELVPGKPGWKKVQARRTAQWLALPQVERGGRSWLAEIEEERIGRWAARHPDREAIAPRLVNPITPPDKPFPLVRWLLDHAVESIPLTERHYMKPLVVAEAVDLFGYREEWIGTLRNEPDIPLLLTAREFVQSEVKALRRSKKSLLLTSRGREMRADDGVLWTYMCQVLGGGTEQNFASAFRRTILQVLVAGPSPSREALAATVAELLATDWTSRSGDNDGVREGVDYYLGDFLFLLRSLRLTRKHERGTYSREIALNEDGLAAALETLRIAATLPRHSPM